MIFSESSIQMGLKSEFLFSSYGCFSNVKDTFYAEADFLRVLRGSMRTEVFEIKVSKADFRADFNKRYWHTILQRRHPDTSIPNRFYYVAPKGLLDLSDIPEYAGFYTIEHRPAKHNPNRTSFDCVKRAPLLHKTPMTPKKYEALCHKLMWRYWSMREQIERVVADGKRYRDYYFENYNKTPEAICEVGGGQEIVDTSAIRSSDCPPVENTEG